MILNYAATLKTIRTLAGNVGMSLVVHGNAQPCTDGRRIILPDPNLDSKVGFEVWLGYAYHEIRHNWPEFRGCFEFAKKARLDMSSPLGQVMNILEDFRIESYKHNLYQGEAFALAKSHEHVCTYKNIPALKEKQNFAPLEAALSATLIWIYKHRTKFQPILQGIAENMLEAADNVQVAKNVELLEKNGLIRRIWRETGHISVEEVYQLALDILELLGIPESEAKQSMAEIKAKGPASGRVLWEDLQYHDHDPEGPSYSKLEIDYTNRVPGAYTSKLSTQIIERPKVDTRSNYVPALASTNLSQQVLRLLEIKSRSKNIHGQHVGKISAKSLYRSQVKDSGKYQTKLFRQKQTRYQLDTAVTVLCDLSGSMGGSKYTHAAHSAMLLNKALSPLGVPLEILGFTTTGDKVRHFIFKESLERIDDDTLRGEFNGAANYMNCNADGDSILWAHGRLVGSKNKRKVLLVLSDGYPSAEGGDIFGYTKKVITAIEKSSVVEIYGLGIESDAVKELYKNYGIVNDISELETTILNTIKNQILN